MKLLTILLTTFITTSALATCNEAYEVINLKTRKKASSLSTTGSAMPPTAAGFFSTSYQLAEIGIVSGYAAGPISATTVVGMTYATPLVSSTAVFNLYRATQYLWVKDILDQSLVGFGKELVGFSEELEYKLGKEVSVEELSYVVNEANEQELFCKAGVKQYTPGEFSNYVEETLKRSL